MKTKWNLLAILALLAMLASVTPAQAAPLLVTITPDTLPEAEYSSSYSVQLNASGGTEPYTFSLEGALPSGFTLSPSGLLSGMSYGTMGTYPITVHVSDSIGATGSHYYDFVLGKGTPIIAVRTAQHVYWGSSFDIFADLATAGGSCPTNGTVAFDIDGVPVAGCGAVAPSLCLVECKGVSAPADFVEHTITGTYAGGTFWNSASGTTKFTVEHLLYNIHGAIFEDLDKDGVLDPTEPYVYEEWTINLDQGCDGSVDYTTTTALSGSYAFYGLPNQECYRITEVPYPGWQQTTVLNDIVLTDNVTNAYIGNWYPTITLTPSDSTLPAGKVGAPYSLQFAASGGTAPYKFTISTGDSPDGLTLSEEGLLSGTPTQADSYYFTVRAEDATGAAGSWSYGLSTRMDGSFTLASSPNPSAPGEEVTFTLTGTGTYVHPDIGPLPPVGTVTFYDGEAAIDGCQNLYLNYDATNQESPFGQYPAVCKTSSLSLGSHSITAAYTDWLGVYNGATATLEGGHLVSVLSHVASISLTYKAGKHDTYTFSGVVTVVDANGNPVNKAVVTVEWTLGDGSTLVQQATTGRTGAATFRNVKDGAGAYTLSVTDVTKSGYTWVPGDNDSYAVTVP